MNCTFNLNKVYFWENYCEPSLFLEHFSKSFYPNLSPFLNWIWLSHPFLGSNQGHQIWAHQVERMRDVPFLAIFRSIVSASPETANVPPSQTPPFHPSHERNENQSHYYQRMLGQSFLPVDDREQALKVGSPRVTGQDRPWQARKIILILSPHQLFSGLCWNSFMIRLNFYEPLDTDIPWNFFQARAPKCLSDIGYSTLELAQGVVGRK